MKKFKKNIFIISTGRSDYGLLKPLIISLNKSKKISSRLIITGTHLSHFHGMTIKEVLKDKLNIYKKIKITLPKDDSYSITKNFSNAVLKFSKLFKQENPDLIIVLGDKYETFAIAASALLNRVPIAHIHGGEITKGAIDDSIRHALTKLSHLHFVSSKKHQLNVNQMGEERKKVFCVGALAVDAIRNSKKISKEKLEKILKFSFLKKNIIVTFNPETISVKKSKNQINVLLQSLKSVIKDTRIIFTMSIADHESQVIKSKILKFVKKNKNAIFFNSLGSSNYYNVVRYSDMIIGNSSSGVIEAPYLKTPSINIGKRQEGRDLSKSVFKCNFKKNQIIKTIKFIYKNKSKIKYDYLYGNGNSTKKIVSILEKQKLKSILSKNFTNFKIL